MDAPKVYTLLTEWAQEFDPEFAKLLQEQPEYATAILAIGRGGKKPRKDIATWKEAKPYMGFFYDEYLEKPVFDAKFDNATVIDALNRFLNCFDIADDSNVWFEKVKAITTDMGFTTDMKAYKADPTAYKGTVADISTMIRVAVTGKTNSPDLYTVMQILGYERTVERIKAAIASLG
jgi:glutamyl-tRNA synthetase